ncbi:MAG: DUF971 domain-containing protein [Gemmatimonadales bacterium]|nr:MAG: DUF971 domain-containing protein [Gemmatimonadales bacterium]
MARNAAERPMEVGPSADGLRLRIRWADGHVSQWQPRRLRIECPCAGCVDELTGQRVLRPESVPADVSPLEITYVGRYALRFRWSDGHDTGIYPFAFLREICPCPRCRSRQGGSGAGDSSVT